MSDESRMVKDPICGKAVDTLRARAVGIFGGVTYYFCSAECKAKFVDPRQAARELDVAEKKQPEKKQLDKKAADKKPPDKKQLTEEGEPVRYARSRIRRITGEVSTPVVQIDLSPNKKPAESDAAVDEALEPARSSRGWAWIAIVMLIIAGGVIFYTLNHR
jgi:YHS domain-containing protein